MIDPRTEMTESTERVRATHLNRGDAILVQYDKVPGAFLGEGRWEQVDHLRVSGPRPPKRAFWAVVKDLHRRSGGGLVAVILDINGAPHRLDGLRGVGIGTLGVTRLLKLTRAAA